MTKKEELLQRVRPHFGLAALWPLLRLPGEPRLNWGMPSPFRPGDRALMFVPKSHAMWLDHGDGSSGDALALLCRLRGCDPDRPSDAVADEFLCLAVQAGVTVPVGISELLEKPSDMTVYDSTSRTRAREEKVSESGTVIREAELIQSDSAYAADSSKVRKKSADDLLALVPADGPILQANLYAEARKAGIHEKNVRAFITELIDSQRVFVWKIRREKSKSAIGYSRQPEPIE